MSDTERSSFTTQHTVKSSRGEEASFANRRGPRSLPSSPRSPHGDAASAIASRRERRATDATSWRNKHHSLWEALNSGGAVESLAPTTGMWNCHHWHRTAKGDGCHAGARLSKQSTLMLSL
ncbi:unnamed protein product [Lampetra planeri]